MVRKLAKAGVTCRRSTAERARLWAGQAAPADPVGELNAIMLRDSLARIRQQSACAVCYEVRLMERLVRTPLVLLLTITGVNVVSAAEFGSEMGPHGNYANGRNVTGRAGLFPSRYQSDETDRSGPIVRAGRNARLRHAILVIAHNLLTRNPYVRAWKALPAHRRLGGEDSRGRRRQQVRPDHVPHAQGRSGLRASASRAPRLGNLQTAGLRTGEEAN
jgi:transposase